MEIDPLESEMPHGAPVADRVSLQVIMPRDLICGRPDLVLSEVVGLMVRHGVGCIPVVDEQRRPVGIVTKFDLVEQLDAAMRAAGNGCPMPSDLMAQTAEDVMMPFALTLDEHATIAHAAAMMTSEGTHHVLVVTREGMLVGLVFAKDIVGWLVEHDPLEG
jgi:CBS domain-containing membrane protein